MSTAINIIILLLLIALCVAGAYLYRMTPVVVTQQIPVEVPVEVPVYTTSYPIGWDYGSPALYWRNRWGRGGWNGGRGGWRGGRGGSRGGRGR